MFIQQIISNAKYRRQTEPNGGGGELDRIINKEGKNTRNIF